MHLSFFSGVYLKNWGGGFVYLQGEKSYEARFVLSFGGHIKFSVFSCFKSANLNPIKAGGSESMYSLGGLSHAPPP